MSHILQLQNKVKIDHFLCLERKRKPYIILLVSVSLHDGNDTVVDEISQRECPRQTHEGVLQDRKTDTVTTPLDIEQRHQCTNHTC